MDTVTTAANLVGAQMALTAQNTQASLLKQQFENKDSLIGVVMEQASAAASAPVGTGLQLNLRG